jgi:DNA gyrase/topoisomerase IV subunit B
MNPEQLRETVFSPQAQAMMRQVIVEDVRHTTSTISVLMSNQVGPRKSWLFETWTGETEAAQTGFEDDDQIAIEEDAE